MKAHIGVDSRVGIVHSLCSTAASVSDVHMLPELLHGEENKVWGDAGYQGQTEAMREAAFHVINSTRLLSIATNLGDTKTIITHPATTTHAKVPEEDKLRVGIRAGTIRLSVGLEDTDDLIDDLKAALA